MPTPAIGFFWHAIEKSEIINPQIDQFTPDQSFSFIEIRAAKIHSQCLVLGMRASLLRVELRFSLSPQQFATNQKSDVESDNRKETVKRLKRT